MEYYSDVKKEQNFAICNNMDGLGGCYAKQNSQAERETNTGLYHLDIESKNYNKLMNITKKNRFTDIDNKLVVTSGERGVGRGNIGVGN